MRRKDTANVTTVRVRSRADTATRIVVGDIFLTANLSLRIESPPELSRRLIVAPPRAKVAKKTRP
jgi:hypothetical protein